jgi:predicted CXXCH cytochrome family protein
MLETVEKQAPTTTGGGKKIQLKNLKHSDFASQETYCFEASVYIDGKKAGTVSNQGCGGCHSYHPNTLYQLLKAEADKLPPHEWRLNEEVLTIQPDADTIISELVTEALAIKDLKSGMRRRILFIGENGEVFETQAMTAAALAVQLVRKDLYEKLKTKTILNLLPFPEALSIYIKGEK